VISRAKDVVEFYRDSARFSSERGNVLDTLLAGTDSAGGRMLAVTDGQRHAALRALIARAFTEVSLAPVVDGVRRNARRLLVQAVERGSVDIASDIAADIPVAATCDLIGVPASDRALILSLTSSALGSDHGVPTAEDTFSAKSEILLYFADLAAQRRRQPREDLISMLVTGEVDGVTLTEDEIIFNCYSVLLGGDETTRLAIISGIFALAEHPDQWRALRDGLADLDRAVEEILRWTTPALHSGRTAMTDVVFGGRLIEEGDIVTVWPASANHDEAQFTEPAAFDLGRWPNRHVTFAYGPHFCLGSALARIEISSVLSGLRELAADLEVAGEPRRVYSNFLSGYSCLPVMLRPLAAAPAAAAG
jgi:cytochrome P450